MDVKMEKNHQMAIEYDDCFGEKTSLATLKYGFSKWSDLGWQISSKNNQIMGNL